MGMAPFVLDSYPRPGTMGAKIQSNKETMGQSRRRNVRIRLDFRNKSPIYAQIGRQVTDLVARGDLAPGDQLPTVRTLAAELGVNFNTVARAYRRLDDAGVISTQHGRGTYVVGKPRRRRRGGAQALEGLALDYLSEAERRGFDAQAALAAVARQISKKNTG
jgi:GntR family transcriptional regulator